MRDQAFDSHAVTKPGSDEVPQLPVARLRGAVLRVFGDEVADYIDEDEEFLQLSGFYASHLVGFEEFLVWVQRVRTAERLVLRKDFEAADKDSGGTLDGDEILALLVENGLMPLRKVFLTHF